MDIVQTDNKIQERNKIAQAMESAIKANPEAEGQIREQYQKQINEVAPTDEEVLAAYDGIAQLPPSPEKDRIIQGLEEYMAEKGIQPQVEAEAVPAEEVRGTGRRVIVDSLEEVPQEYRDKVIEYTTGPLSLIGRGKKKYSYILPTETIEVAPEETIPADTEITDVPFEEVPAEEVVTDEEAITEEPSLEESLLGIVPQEPVTEEAPVEEATPITPTEEVVTIAPLNIEFSKNEGRNVNYQGIEGRIKIDSDGAPYIFTRDGDVVYIEGGLSGQTPQQLGVQPLADDVINEADIETVLEDETAPLDQNQLQYDFDNNAIILYGKPFTYEGVETNSKGQTTALRLRDTNGKIKFVRNEDTILEFEIQKELYEKSRTNKQPTIESATAAAEQLQVVPIVRVEQVSKPVQQKGSTSDTKGDKVAPAPKGRKKAAPVKPIPAVPKKEEAPKPQPKKEEPKKKVVELNKENKIFLNGRQIGEIEGLYKVVDNEYQITGISINDKSLRGKGYGKEVYRQLIKRLQGEGKILISDNTALSKDAKNVWESFVKSGEAKKTNTGYESISISKPKAESTTSKPTTGTPQEGDVESFETSKGSVYTVLPDGRTQRFKTATKELNEPQDLTVFVKFKDGGQEQDFLEGIQRSESSGTKVYVIDLKGNKYDTNEQAAGKDVRLALVKDGKVIDTVETSLEPKIGYNTFDQRRFEKNGEEFRQIHLGNKVAKINYKKTTSTNPQEGDAVEIAPQREGGSPRKMVFKDGEWKQNVGGDIVKVGPSVQGQAQEMFAGKTETKAEETKPAAEKPQPKKEKKEAPKATFNKGDKVMWEGEERTILSTVKMGNDVKYQIDLGKGKTVWTDGKTLESEKAKVEETKPAEERPISLNDIKEKFGENAYQLTKKYIEKIGEEFTDLNRIAETADRILDLGEKSKTVAVAEALQYEIAYPDNWADLRKAIKLGGIQTNAKAIGRMLDVGVKLPSDIVELYNKSVPTSKQEGNASTEFDGMKKPSKIKMKTFDGKHGKGAFERMKNITDNFEDIMDGLSEKIKQDCL